MRLALARGVAAIAARDMAAMAPQMRATHPPGTRGAERLAPSPAAANARSAITASTAARAATATKAPRQWPKRAKTPPTSGPTSTVTLQTLARSANTRGQRRSGKVPRTSTYARADRRPPPKPCMKRPATTWPIEGASEESSAPAPKMTAPAENARPGPATAVNRPVQVAATIEDARYAVVGQLMRAAPPRSATMLGSTVARSRTFMEWRSTPPSSTASAGIHCGSSISPQVASTGRRSPAAPAPSPRSSATPFLPA